MNSASLTLTLSDTGDAPMPDAGPAIAEHDRTGRWLRRRCLDGSLDRAPQGFYRKVWHLLTRCKGLSFGDQLVPSGVTKESTAGELNFALRVESALNSISHSELRQLMVEAVLMLCFLVQNAQSSYRLNDVVHIGQIVVQANKLFIEEQRELDGDVTLCCGIDGPPPAELACGGQAGICYCFYDSPPTGRYGTMSYLGRAILSLLPSPVTADGLPDWSI